MPADDNIIEMQRRQASAAGKSPDNTQLVNWLRLVAEQRDKHAFERLYRYLAPRLYGYMIRIGATSDQAEDLVQETLAEVWRKAALYRADLAAVTTWVFAIGRNLRIDRIRKVRHFEVPSEPAVDQMPSEQVDYGCQLDALDLLERMKQLPREQFQILQLSYIEGLSQSEISRRLDVPLGTVKSRVRLAFARIRQEVFAQ